VNSREKEMKFKQVRVKQDKLKLVYKMRRKFKNSTREYFELHFRSIVSNTKVQLNTTSEFFRNVVFNDVVQLDYTITERISETFVQARECSNMIVIERNELFDRSNMKNL